MSLFVKIIVLIYCSSFLRFFAEIPNVRIAPTIISDQAAIGAVSPVPGPLASPRTPTSGAAASPRTPTSGCTGANASPSTAVASVGAVTVGVVPVGVVSVGSSGVGVGGRRGNEHPLQNSAVYVAAAYNSFTLSGIYVSSVLTTVPSSLVQLTK